MKRVERFRRVDVQMKMKANCPLRNGYRSKIKIG